MTSRMPFELQHAQLPSFAQSWPEELAQLIAARLESELPSEDVRTIVLAVTHDRQRIGAWVTLEWEDYPYAEDVSTAVGFVSLAPWLDQVDAIARGEVTLPGPAGWSPHLPLTFEDDAKTDSLRAWWLELHRALTATAIELATKHLATRFTQPVGVFMSMTGSEARLVAFCHPDGAPLWPLREHRREHGYGSAYTHGTLGDDALTMFYPQGEGADEGGAPTIRRRALTDVVRAQLADDDLHLQFAGEPFSIRFSHGHTSEELGGPAAEDVAAALAAFAKKTGKLDAPGAPIGLPDAATFQSAFDAQGDEWGAWLGRLVETHGAPAVSERVRALQFGEQRMQDLHRTVACLARDVGAWEVALTHFALLTGKLRADWRTHEHRALVALSRWDEVLRTPSDDAPERALALFSRGDVAAARAELEGKTSGDALAVLAMMEAGTSEARATGLLTRALADGIRPHLEVHVRAHPLLGRLLEERTALEAARVASRAAVAALEPSTLDRSTERQLVRAAAESLFAAPFAGDGDGKLRLALRRGDGWLAIDDNRRIVELHEGRPATTLWEGEVESLVAVRTGLVAASSTRLTLLDAQGTQLATLDSPLRFTGELASRGALVAATYGDTVRLARVEGTTLRWAGTLTANDRVYVTSLGFVSDDRLLLASSEGLVLVDCADVLRLRPLARVEGDFTLLDTWTGSALLKSDRGATLLDALTLRTRWTVELGHQPFLAHARDGRLALGSRGEVLLVDPTTLRTERHVLCAGDGHPLDDTLALTIDADRAVALTKDRGVVVLDRVPFDVGALRHEVESELPRVRDWVKEQLEQWVSDDVVVGGEEEGERAAEPLGGVVGFWVERFAVLRPQGPRSVLNADAQTAVDLAFERPEPERKRGGDDERARAAQRLSDTLAQLTKELSSQLRNAAMAKVLREAMARVAPRTKARELFVGIESGSLCIVDVLRGGGTVPPFRVEVKPPAPRSLRELMSAGNWYQSVDAWTQRAKREPAFRDEVLALLAEGELRAAARVARQLVDVDLEGCARAWLSAAEVDLEFALDGLLLLAEQGHAGARARLQPLCELDAPELALPARRALGRLDEDATLTLVRTALAALEEYGEDDAPVKTLAALSDARLAQLKDALLAAKEVLRRPGPLLVPLVRAGWTPDDETLEQGHEARLQDDDFMGELFGDEPPDATATAVRLFLARQVAENVRLGQQAWPDAPLEKSRRGWQRFFTVAWPEWERAGVLDGLFALLPRLAASSKPAAGEKLGRDATLALQVLHQALLRGDARATQFAEALEAAQLPEDARRPVIQLARSSRLMFGWSLLKQRQLAEARRVADAALADAPEDGQAHFFSARLAWLEQNDPRAAVPHLEAGLRLASDDVGRARLLNLQGAVWDELGDFAKALEWFHKALALSDSGRIDHDTGQKRGDPTMTHAILSNIAEMHWKLGQRDEARKYADQAARRGSKTDIVKSILSETA